MSQRRVVKVWNKTVVVHNVPDDMPDEEVIFWAKQLLIKQGANKYNQEAS